jgi:xylulokinase
MGELLLGLDLGTTGCKAVIANKDLEVLGESYIEYGLINLSAKEIEQDADEWWDISAEAISTAICTAGVCVDDIKAMSVSSQGIAFVPVDAGYKPLRNAMSWLDTRAGAESEEMAEKYGCLEVFRMTGKRISSAYTLPKLIWLKKHEPGIYGETYKFLMAHDFMIAKLTGKSVTDHTMASGTLAYDIRMQEWRNDLLSDFGIDHYKLPHIAFSGSIAGIITKEAAKKTGLSEKTMVCVGGQDQKCAALGAGIGMDDITVSLGTATAIEKLSSCPDTRDDMRIPVFSYLFKNSWASEGVIPTSGVSLKWFRDLLMRDMTYRDIDDAAKSAAVRDPYVFFYPFLNGMGSPDWYNDPKGCFYGLDLSSDLSDIALSVLEAVAFQIKSNILCMTDPSLHVKELRVFGGGSASDLWCGIIADVTGIRVSTLCEKETACIGACILAGIGCGMYNDTDAILDKIRIKNTFIPQKDKMSGYEKKYNAYMKIQDKIMG